MSKSQSSFFQFLLRLLGFVPNKNLVPVNNRKVNKPAEHTNHVAFFQGGYKDKEEMDLYFPEADDEEENIGAQTPSEAYPEQTYQYPQEPYYPTNGSYYGAPDGGYQNPYQPPNNDNYYYDNNYTPPYLEQNDYYEPGPSFFRKRKSGWALAFGAISFVLFGIGLGLFIFFFVVPRFVNESSAPNFTRPNRNQISSFYTTSSKPDDLAAVQYIYQRTVSVQFIFTPSTPNSRLSAKAFSGTAWIFNQVANSDYYYLATNLHVAKNANISQTRIPNVSADEDLSNFTLNATYIGFLGDNSFLNRDDVAVNAMNQRNVNNNINILRVPNPEIAYAATTDFDQTGFGGKYKQYDNHLKSDPKENLNHFGALDFAILQFNFNNEQLEALNKEPNTGNSDSVAFFRSFLNTYQANPTEYLLTPVDTVNEKNKFFSTSFWMGGFPGVDNRTRFSGSLSNNRQNLNHLGVAWFAFSDFPIAIKANSNQLPENFPTFLETTNYDNFASGNTAVNINKNPDALFSDRNRESFQTGIKFKNPISNQVNSYINVGHNGYTAADSLPGSSGSMVITKDTDGKWKVAGIYWGAVFFNSNIRNPLDNINGNNRQLFSYGAFNLLNVAKNGDLEGYNIFANAISYLNTHSLTKLPKMPNQARIPATPVGSDENFTGWKLAYDPFVK